MVAPRQNVLLGFRHPAGTYGGLRPLLEPDVTLTDFALAAAALFGGIWHGVFSGNRTVVGDGIWFATLAALALAAAALWHVTAILLQTGPWPGRLRLPAVAQVFGQLMIAIFLTDTFAVGAAGMLPALVLVFLLCLRQYRATHEPRIAIGLVGFALAALSGLVILLGISLHPRWGTPIAPYHVTQFVAFGLVFLSIPALRVYPR